MFGALCLSVLGIAFPALMEICVLWPDRLGPFNWVVIRNVILIAIGLFGLVTGTNKSIVDIIDSFRTPIIQYVANVTSIPIEPFLTTQPNSL